jgi:hypothetical protein
MSVTAKRTLWIVWILITLSITGYLGAAVFVEDARNQPWLAAGRSFLLPGETTHGHYQIELACESCHMSPFGGREAIQQACVGCHGQELKEADDKHPLTKFTDPRNAEITAIIDATQCVTCHEEHRPEITSAMAVSVPQDFCAHCHQNIAQERPSHEGMGFDTCASAGCHNFHDNRALYEDFLLRHAEDAATKHGGTLVERDWRQLASMLPHYPAQKYPLRMLERTHIDAPEEAAAVTYVVDDWLASSHARAGVNCSGCHQPEREDGTSEWTDRPTEQACRSCHALEVESFLTGKHGMRIAQQLAPMTPAQARLPMNDAAAHVQLGCASCHGAHTFDTRTAAVEACLGCHRDPHTMAYRDSPHYRLWQKELAGDAPTGSGVTCASCHMPRIEHRDETFDLRWMRVQHNQNDTLRPNEKILRPVCLECHGLGFAIDALADTELIRNNFNGQPARHIRSIDMAVERDRQYRESREASRADESS